MFTALCWLYIYICVSNVLWLQPSICSNCRSEAAAFTTCPWRLVTQIKPAPGVDGQVCIYICAAKTEKGESHAIFGAKIKKLPPRSRETTMIPNCKYFLSK